MEPQDYVIFVNDRREIDFRTGGQALPAGSTPIVASDSDGHRAVLHTYEDVEFTGDKPTLYGPPEYRAGRWRVADFEAAVQETMGIPPRGADQIRREIARLEGELTTLSGEGLLISQGSEDLRDWPDGGAFLTVDWAIDDQSYQEWYPTTEAAKAALLALARSEGRTPTADGLRVDLTARGCHTSQAYVTRRG